MQLQAFNKGLLFFILLLGVGALVLIYSKNMSFNPINTYEPEAEEVFESVKTLYPKLQNEEGLEVATFAGGCFWCMEGPYEQEEGVKEAVAGYARGVIEETGTLTGQREAVQVFYDPTKIDYEKLLKIYWWQIDPTDPGGQFADRGEKYKTAIFYENENEKTLAEKSKKELGESGKYDKPIATQVLEFKDFSPAEDYHQNYYKTSSSRYQRYKFFSGREGFIKKNREINP